MQFLDLEVFVSNFHDDCLEPVQDILPQAEIQNTGTHGHVRFSGNIDEDQLKELTEWFYGLPKCSNTCAGTMLFGHGTEPCNIEYHNPNHPKRNWREEMKEMISLLGIKTEHLLHITG